MIDTKLILLEGLPGTGKSTNSYFLLRQLELNGKQTKWIHEVERPHPVSFFKEACLTYDEYNVFLDIYPQYKYILNDVAIFRKSTVGIDLQDLQWNQIISVEKDALQYLKKFDAWHFSLNRQMDILLEKWTYFTERVLEENEVIILDSGVFQFQIFTFLLKNAPYIEMQRFIEKLIEIMKPLNPNLIYFCREDVEDTIGFLEKLRGKRFLEDIWKRDKDESYYFDKPKGAEGHKCFLKDYSNAAKKLIDIIDCRKISIEITNQSWEEYENKMLSFLKLERKTHPRFSPPNGVFKNEILDIELKVKGLLLIDPNGVNRILTPKSEFEFYVECLPTVLSFCDNNTIKISGGQIIERWTTSGTIFVKA